jgi:hypothetical protein
MFPNKRKNSEGGELIFIIQAPVNKRFVVVNFLLMQNSEKNVCCCESELVISILEDRVASLKCIPYMLMQPEIRCDVKFIHFFGFQYKRVPHHGSHHRGRFSRFLSSIETYLGDM